MGLTVYQYPKCSTCRKALRWLDEHGVPYQALDIVQTPPSKSTLLRSIKESGLPLRSFFNTSGESYRSGGYKDKLQAMSASDAADALAADGKLIKRPFAMFGSRANPRASTSDTGVLVGFDEKAWAEALL